jgi:hypothetical protein
MYARKVSLHFMDTGQARIQGMRGSKRMRSLPLMFIKPSGSKGRWRPFEPEGI